MEYCCNHIQHAYGAINKYQRFSNTYFVAKKVPVCMQSDNNDLTIFIVAQNLYIQFENDDFYNLLIMKSILRLIFYSQGLLFSKYIECKLKLLQ